MLQLRPYQADAVDAILKEFEDIDSTLLVASVGAGKTIMQASFIQRVIGDYPEARFVCAVHTRELVKQNFEALIKAWPFAPAGINSAALGQRSTRAQILFCSIQSVYKLAQQIGWVDCLIIDESHLVSPNGTTMYRQFIAELRAINPDLRILGMSGTPFRMDMGMLTDGDDPLFKTVAYEIGVGKLIEDGYLTRPISKGTATTFDVSGVHTRGGEYVAGELERAVNKSEITEAAVDEIIRYGSDRRAWIAFAAGVDHAAEIRDEMNRRGIVAEMVEGSMPAAERTRIIENYKAGRIKCLTNVNVLSIGFDYPAIDLIALMRPTKSPALYIQQCGRGLRLAPGKDTCLILDFANVVRTLGPIDNVQIKTPSKGTGEAPIRICPECQAINHAAARVCVDCGHQFPEPEIKVNAVAEDLPVLSNATTWRTVTSRRFAEHPGKEGKPPSVKCSYTCGFLNVNSWLCPQHGGYAKTKADHWWRDHGGQRPFPDSVEAWLLRQHELNDTAEIEIEYNGKWPNAKNYRAASTAITPEERALMDRSAERLLGANNNQPPAANDNEPMSAGMSEILDGDFIPF